MTGFEDGRALINGVTTFAGALESYIDAIKKKLDESMTPEIVRRIRRSISLT
jgi:hypothetical protein